MKKFIIYAVALIGCLAVHTGCYNDLGNYAYEEVNTLEIEVPEVTVRMPKTEAVEVSIMPKISQTLEKSEEFLVYEWRKRNTESNTGNTFMDHFSDYSEGKECVITIEPNQADNIKMLLIVTDKRNNTKWYKTCQVSVLKPFNPCWFVLQEKEGAGLLGAVEGIPGAYFVYPDVFESEANVPFPLQGKPLALSGRKKYGSVEAALFYSSYGFRIDPALILITDQDVAMLTPSTLNVKYKSDKILYEPALQNNPRKIEYHKLDEKGELFVNDGKAYVAFLDGFCVPYSLRWNGNFPKISAYGSFGEHALFYNEADHCFLRAAVFDDDSYFDISPTSNRIRQGRRVWNDQYPVRAGLVGQNGTFENKFDPNAIDPTLKMRDILRGGPRGYYAYAVAAPTGGTALTVFKFSGVYREDPYCLAKYELPLPDGVDVEKAKFAVSYVYSANFLFMSAGNKFYRVDLDRNKVVELYAHEGDASAQIVAMKLKDSEDALLGMSVGLGINSGEKGVLVELQLTASGDVDRGENGVFVYDDAKNPLGRIVDILYNYE